MDLNGFLAAREGRWQRLSLLLDKAEAGGVERLSPREVDELFRLHRLVSSDLNLAQTRTGNPAVLDYLESIVARGYGLLSAPSRPRLLAGWWRILRHRFPLVFRQHRSLAALAAAAMIAGIVFGWITTAVQPDLAVVFLPPEHLVESPSQRVAHLEEMERSGNTRVSSTGSHAIFSTFLFTHNIRVSVLAFALGLTFGIGTLIVLFFNGAMLGSIAQRYFDDGVFEFFVAWVGPHGAIELPCIVFAGTAGLMLARAQWRSESGGFRVQMRQQRGQLVAMLVGAATLLVVAGLVEGGFSQINEPTLPYPFKIAVAAILFAALLAYLFLLPVDPSTPTPDLSPRRSG